MNSRGVQFPDAADVDTLSDDGIDAERPIETDLWHRASSSREFGEIAATETAEAVPAVR